MSFHFVQRHGLTGPIVGHAGDGNFHASLMFDPSDAKVSQRQRYNIHLYNVHGTLAHVNKVHIHSSSKLLDGKEIIVPTQERLDLIADNEKILQESEACHQVAERMARQALKVEAIWAIVILIKMSFCQQCPTIQVGGTVTGEHGVGLGKVALLEEQFGEDGVGVMRNIKAALDPRFVKNLASNIWNYLVYMNMT